MNEIRIERITGRDVKERGIDRWDIWEKDPSEFEWAYTNEEHCFIIEGKATITTEDGSVGIKKGDYVVFPVGLRCRWKVTEGIRKYYDLK